MALQQRAYKRKARNKSKIESGNHPLIDAGAIPIDRSAVAALIEAWLNDSSGYDEAVWPILQTEIETNRLAQRARFHE